jgi:ATP-dependent RNA helicase RhlE
VINFDVPNTPEAYTHRIGRTGRAERQGIAYTFVTGADHAWVRATERLIGSPIPRRELEGFEPDTVIGTPAAAAPRSRTPARRTGPPRKRWGRNGSSRPSSRRPAGRG